MFILMNLMRKKVMTSAKFEQNNFFAGFHPKLMIDPSNESYCLEISKYTESK